MMELGEKRLFILVSGGGLVLLAMLAGAAWFLIAPRMAELHPDLPRTLGAAALLAFLLIAFGLGLIALSALTGRRVLFSQRVTATVVRILFPLVLILSSLVRIDKDAVKRSFVAVNNALVRAGRDTIRRGTLLLLLPRRINCFRKLIPRYVEFLKVKKDSISMKNMFDVGWRYSDQ